MLGRSVSLVDDEARPCWACRGDRTTSDGLGFCYVCNGQGDLPGNPMDRRGRHEYFMSYSGPERRAAAAGAWR